MALAALTVLALLIVGPSQTLAQADDKPHSMVVFVLKGAEDSSELRNKLTSVIREEAGQHDDYELVHDEPVVLSDAAVVLGCESVSTTCLEKAADQFGANFMIFGSIEDVDGRSRVSVRLFDASKGRYVESFGRVLTKLEEPYDPFRNEVGRLLGSEDGAEKTMLKVRSNVKNATVEIDGLVAGKTPVDREGLEPGQHDVRVEADNHEPWDKEIELEPGDTVELQAELEESEPAVSLEDSETEDQSTATTVEPKGAGSNRVRGVSRWGPWVAIGAGAAALAGGGVAGAEVARANNDLEDWRQENGDNTEECETEPECDIIERGQNAQTAHGILLGVGGASVVGGVVWLVVRDLGPNQSRDETAAPRLQFSAAPRSVSIGWRW